MKSKKGAIVLWLSALGIIIALLGFFALFISAKPAISYVGETEIELLKTYQQAEKALFYIDQSAKLAAYQSVYDFGQRGGFSSEPKCGNYSGYNLWSNATKGLEECWPEDINESFKNRLGKNLDSYLGLYDELYLPKENYNFDLHDNLEIIGIAKKDIKISSATAAGQGNLRWPIDKEPFVSSCFGKREPPCVKEDNGVCLDYGTEYHQGIDIPAVNGTPVYAVAGGEVIEVEKNWNGCGDGIQIEHKNLGILTTYCHLSKFNVTKGKTVSTGDKIGEVGRTGCPTCGYHLHFGVKKGRDYVDPLSYFAAKDIQLNMDSLSCKTAGRIKYEVSPPFKIKIDYDLTIYNKIKENVATLLNCKGDPRKCVNENIKEFNKEKDLEWETSFTEDENIILFDITQKDKEFPIKDGIKNPVIKFGLYFKDITPPPPVKNIKVNDTKIAERNVTVSWNRSEANDTDHYNIYYSNKEFNSVEEGIRFIENILNPVNISNHDPDQEIYSTTVKVPTDAIDYYFAVTAIDKTGNENLSVEPVLGKSIDDLAPSATKPSAVDKPGGKVIGLSWEIPQTNIDGSPRVDEIEKFKIYRSEESFSDVAEASLVKEALGMVTETEVNVPEDKTYWFAVTAVDEAGNEQKSLVFFNRVSVTSTPT